MKNIFKITTMVILMGASSHVFANDQSERGFDRLYCSDGEVEALIVNSRENAIKKTVENRKSIIGFKRNNVYEREFGDNAVEQDECSFMTLPDFRAMYTKSKRESMRIMDQIQGAFSGGGLGMSMPDIDYSSLMHRLAERMCGATQGLIDTAKSTFRDERDFAVYEKLKDTALSGFVSDYLFESYVNDQLYDNFSGSRYLEWRGGMSGGAKPREDTAKNDVDDRVRNAVRGLF